MSVVKFLPFFINFCVSYFIFPFPLLSGFGGLAVSMASGTQVHGFKPGRSRQIFQAKNP
jgi:hypothetical protein